MSKSKEEVTVGELRNLLEGIDPNTKLSFYNNSKPMPFHEVVDQLRELNERSGGGDEKGLTVSMESYSKLVSEYKELELKILQAPIAYAVKDVETGELDHLSFNQGYCITQCIGTDLKYKVVPVKLLPMEEN